MLRNWFFTVGVVASVVVTLGCAGSPPPGEPPAADERQPTAVVRPATPTVAKPASLIAYVGRDDNIYVVEPNGANSRQVSPRGPSGNSVAAPIRRVHNWPTWAPDGRKLSFARSTFDEDGDLASGEVLVVDWQGQNLRRLYHSDVGALIYMAWSPDGQSLGLLAQEGSDLKLFHSDGAEAEPAPLVSGNPLYFAWSPDSKRLLTHVGGDARRGGGQLSVLSRDDRTATPRPLQPAPSAFRAPAWFADSARGLWVGGEETTARLLVRGIDDGESEADLAESGANPAFVVSPTRDEVAYSAAVRAGRPLYRGIWLAQPGAAARQIVEAEVVAFFWSPDGEWLAHVASEADSDALAWWVARRDGSDRRQLMAFQPTRSVSQWLVFFDQYAQSVTLWSPNSDRLVVVTRESGANGQTTNRVYVAPIDGSPPTAIGEGNLAFWSLGDAPR